MAALTQKWDTHMANRAVLLDRDDQIIAHLTYAEMDGYIERGLVERLTQIRATTHKFRLVPVDTSVLKSEIFDHLDFDQSSLDAATSRANAGVSDTVQATLWARRRVRHWPYVGDMLATRAACQLAKPLPKRTR